MKIIILVFIALLAAIPPLIGFYGKTVITNQLKEAEKTINTNGEVIKLTLVKHELGYLNSIVTIKVKAMSIGTDFEQEAVVSVSNLPSLDHLLEGQYRFNFKGDIPKLVFTPAKLSAFSLPLPIPEKPKFTVQGTRYEGGFYYPSGLEAKAVVDTIQTAEDFLKLQNLWIQVSIHDHQWVSSMGFDKLNLNSPFLKIEGQKFLISTTQGRTAENPGVVFELKFELDSPALGIPGGVKLLTKADFNKFPKKQNEFSLKNAFESGIKADLLFNLLASASKLEATASASIDKAERPATPEDEYSFNLNGNFLIAIAAEDKKKPMFAKALQSLEEKAEEMKREYDINLTVMPIKVPFQLKNKRFFLNSIPYFKCNEMQHTQKSFNSLETKAMPIEKLRSDAIEDLLAEDDQKSLAESYCRLKYVVEITDPKDAISKILLTLMDLKINYQMNLVSLTHLDQKINDLTLAFKGLENEEELLIFTSFFHCFMDFKSTACTEGKSLITHIGEDHPFKKLIGLYYKTELNPEEVKKIMPEESRPENIKRLYSFFRTRILNNYFLAKKLPNKMNENIVNSKSLFTRNFLTYETLSHNCNFKDFATCAESIEKVGFEGLPQRFKVNYLEGMVKVIKGKLAQNSALSCVDLIEEMWKKVSVGDKNSAWMKPDWWSQNASLIELQKFCSSASSVPAQKTGP